MTPEEAFDSAARAAETTLKEYPLEAIERPNTFRTFLQSLSSITSWRTRANAETMAANIASAIKVLLATRSLTTTSSEKRKFADALLALQAEYMASRNKALQGNSSRYSITESLREQRQALMDAYKKMQESTSVMTQISNAMTGLSALIQAIS